MALSKPRRRGLRDATRALVACAAPSMPRRPRWSDFEVRPQLHTLTLALPPPLTDRAAVWSTSCEAVEILMLASKVNPQAFQTMVLRMCWSAFTPIADVLDLDAVLPLRLYIQVGTNPNMTWQMAALTTLFEPTARSDAFTETYATLVQMASERRLALEKVEFPVDINLYDHNKQFTIDVLSLFTRHHCRQLDDGVAFVVGNVSLVWSALIDSTAFAAADRKMMWRWMATATGLRGNGSVLPDNGDSGSDDQIRSPYRRVRCQKLAKEVFATLCASLMLSTRVRELDVYLTSSRENPLSCGLEWCWLIYALFNEASCHSVTALKIDDAEFRMRDLVRVRELVQSQRPLEMLLDPEFDELWKTTRPHEYWIQQRVDRHV